MYLQVYDNKAFQFANMYVRMTRLEQATPKFKHSKEYPSYSASYFNSEFIYLLPIARYALSQLFILLYGFTLLIRVYVQLVITKRCLR